MARIVLDPIEGGVDRIGGAFERLHEADAVIEQQAGDASAAVVALRGRQDRRQLGTRQGVGGGADVDELPAPAEMPA
jgi:hypothetical protein